MFCCWDRVEACKVEECVAGHCTCEDVRSCMTANTKREVCEPESEITRREIRDRTSALMSSRDYQQIERTIVPRKAVYRRVEVLCNHLS